jgi:hypothetical protein
MRDVVTGRDYDGGQLRLAELLDRYPVALLVPIAAPLPNESSNESLIDEREKDDQQDGHEEAENDDDDNPTIGGLA